MKILFDTSVPQLTELAKRLPAGQLHTPKNRHGDWGGEYAIDNGAFSGFDRVAFEKLLSDYRDHRDRCLFVAVPDVVGSARRTLECFRHWSDLLCQWPLALVAQDGIEDLEIPWDSINTIFIGGTTGWKESESAVQVIRAAQVLGKHVHVGRVNTPRRYAQFSKLGVDSCDGSGLARYYRKSGELDAIEAIIAGHMPLIDDLDKLAV